MIGKIVWWSEQKTQGLVSVVSERGEITNYFLLASKIVQRPAKILAGYHVKFRDALQLLRSGLLPLAVGVVVSETPLDAGVAGANPLTASQNSEVRR